MKIALVLFAAIHASYLADLETKKVECFTCGQNSFFGEFSREKGSKQMCDEIITAKHLRICPRQNDVCKTKISRQRHFVVDSNNESVNTTIETIERSCAHIEERPENLLIENRYLETKENENGMIIEEIEEIYCENNACNFHEATDYYVPEKKTKEIFSPIVGEEESSSLCLGLSTILALALLLL